MTQEQKNMCNIITRDNLENSLNTNNYPQDKINGILKTIEDRIRCDSDCQQAKQVDYLKQSWLTSKNEYKELPNITLGIRENIRKDDGIEKIRINNLCFVDDLIIFGKGNNLPQIKKSLKPLIDTTISW